MATEIVPQQYTSHFRGELTDIKEGKCPSQGQWFVKNEEFLTNTENKQMFIEMLGERLEQYGN